MTDLPKLTPKMTETLLVRLTAMDLVQRSILALQLANKPVTKESILEVAYVGLSSTPTVLKQEVPAAVDEFFELLESLSDAKRH